MYEDIQLLLEPFAYPGRAIANWFDTICFGNKPVLENHRQPLALLPNNSKFQCNKPESVELLPTLLSTSADKLSQRLFRYLLPLNGLLAAHSSPAPVSKASSFPCPFSGLPDGMKSSYYNIFPFYLL